MTPSLLVLTKYSTLYGGDALTPSVVAVPSLVPVLLVRTVLTASRLLQSMSPLFLVDKVQTQLVLPLLSTPVPPLSVVQEMMSSFLQVLTLLLQALSSSDLVAAPTR